MRQSEMAKTLRGSALTIARIAVCAGLAGGLVAAAANDATAAGGTVLRVCADPGNMPFSNAEGDGFENKLAELIAEKLDSKLEYAWFSESSGYVPNT
ncbi:MAG: hypothetical protein R6X03_05005, partial [Methyloceanibacter sp.]